MNIDDIAKIAGVLGFLISLATFALTRWERRARVHFGLTKGTQEMNDDLEPYHVDTVEFTLTNLGGVAVVVDLRSLEVRRGEHTFFPWQQDHWGAQESEVLLAPLGAAIVSLPHGTFEDQLKIESPRQYDQQSFNALIRVEVSVRSTTGARYTSNSLRYWEAIGEFRRA